jgi:SSS family solute:Na+ symporter
MLGLFLLGLISRRAKSSAAVPGVVAGVLLVVWMVASRVWLDEGSALRSPFHGFLNLVFGTLAVILVGFALTAIAARRRGERATPES